ncbi:Trm112 family protein [Candidatus Woesearchaeota archaeon]|jgi:uncharacterized protein YbaR (Trm112 family)|nr:Trm112 family protein [Candidatus Woesearchaeota archaeon]MBT6023301.1 Trm112 family protein [Candidatus Woesearchaeota archaeon]
MIQKELLDVLACPDDKSELDQGNGKLICKKCKRVFKIEDGIPIMLPKDF